MTQKKTITAAILDAIASSGGMRFTDIQRLAWDSTLISRPHRPRRQKMSRGWWCTNLIGTGCRAYNHGGHPGILSFYCVKGEDGLWRRNGVDHRGRPWRTMRQAINGVHSL